MDALLKNLPKSTRIYEAALEGLSRVNEAIYRADPSLPSIYAGGVKYRREVGENWRHVADVLRELWGDCEDLATARVGELRARGEAGARARVRRVGPRLVHVDVVRADGTTEDPSVRLGMGKGDPMRGDDDVSGYEDVIGADPTPGIVEVSWTVDKTPTGWRGTVRVPLTTGHAFTIRAPGVTKTQAAQSALMKAAKLLDSPVAQALIPPQAKLALALAQRPELRAVGKKLLSLF